MISIETISKIKNATITIVSNGKVNRTVLPNSSFQAILLARTLDIPTENSHVLIRDVFLEILDENLKIHDLSQIDSFRFSYTDEDGYKHIIER